MNARLLPLTPWSAPSPWSLRPRPLIVLCLSLALFGIGEAMLLESNLGSAPWTILAQGIALKSGLEVGLVVFWVSVAVLLLWIPLKLRPGIGTILNALIIALTIAAFMRLVPPPEGYLARWLFCLGGVGIIGVASALYLTCHLGAGPRDGLMVGLCYLTRQKVGIVRTLLEGSVCLAGYLLGGVVGVGTLIFAFGVGWVVQISLALIARAYPQG